MGNESHTKIHFAYEFYGKCNISSGKQEMTEHNMGTWNTKWTRTTQPFFKFKWGLFSILWINTSILYSYMNIFLYFRNFIAYVFW